MHLLSAISVLFLENRVNRFTFDAKYENSGFVSCTKQTSRIESHSIEILDLKRMIPHQLFMDVTHTKALFWLLSETAHPPPKTCYECDNLGYTPAARL